MLLTSRRSPPPATPEISLLACTELSLLTIALICLSYSASERGVVGGGCGGNASSCGKRDSIMNLVRSGNTLRVPSMGNETRKSVLLCQIIATHGDTRTVEIL